MQLWTGLDGETAVQGTALGAVAGTLALWLVARKRPQRVQGLAVLLPVLGVAVGAAGAAYLRRPASSEPGAGGTAGLGTVYMRPELRGIYARPTGRGTGRVYMRPAPGTVAGAR